jgi:hypothetical protein
MKALNECFQDQSKVLRCDIILNDTIRKKTIFIQRSSLLAYIDTKGLVTVTPNNQDQCQNWANNEDN